MNVHIVIRKIDDDRVLPRFARYLMRGLGWTASDKPDPRAEANYYFAYFEYPRGHADTPSAAYFTHREEQFDSEKVRVYDATAKSVGLRVVMNAAQVKTLNHFGLTRALPLPLETEHFTLKERPPHTPPILGMAGYTYKSGRKGEALFEQLRGALGNTVDWQASGRGWPIPCELRPWAKMPAFYQSLDYYVCTSLVEGGPMGTLEALATGAQVIIPDTVGIHPELPDIPGIWRYHTGDAADLVRVTRAALASPVVDRASLRAAVAGRYNVAAFVEAHRVTFEDWLYGRPVTSPLSDWMKHCGIYVVAFGDPAREQARRCVQSARQFMPAIPIAVCSDRPLDAGETRFIQQPDADIGGRMAKLKVYDLAPQEWQCVLYVDADTEFVADVSFLFQLVADGWEFVICKDAHLHDTVKALERRNNGAEYQMTVQQAGSDETLAINGGVWAFRRGERTAAFFKRWLDEWARFKGRDQAALIRALYADPLRVYWLGNEWNTLITLKGEEYPPGRAGSAGIIHHVGKARRWEGQVPAGKGLTDPEAWAMVAAFESKRGKK